MTRKKEILTIILAIIGTFATVLGVAGYFLFVHRYRGKNVVDKFNSKDTFDITSVQTLEKKKDKDFVILNLADVQFEDDDPLTAKYAVHNEITYLVNEYKPDLITLTGDQTWGDDNLISLQTIITWLESYKIPWAPIFGNHDYGDDYNSAVAGEKYCCDLYEEAKYCLFKRGPTNIGILGNYVLNITEEGKIVKTLYMMNYGRLQDFTTSQQSWFKWVANGIKANNNDTYSDAMMFTHKPTLHRSAYNNYLKKPENAEGTVYAFESFSNTSNSSFITSAKKMGVTDFLCGHIHSNNFTINYDGARYTFCVKTGETCYWHDKDGVYLNGATEIRIGSEKTSILHHYVEKGKYTTGITNHEDEEILSETTSGSMWLFLTYDSISKNRHFGGFNLIN